MPTPSVVRETSQRFEEQFRSLLLLIVSLPVNNTLKEKLVDSASAINGLFRVAMDSASIVTNAASGLGYDIGQLLPQFEHKDQAHILGATFRCRPIFRSTPIEFFVRLDQDWEIAKDIEAVINLPKYLEIANNYSPLLYTRCVVEDPVTANFQRGFIIGLNATSTECEIYLLDIGRVVVIPSRVVLPLHVEAFPILDHPSTVYKCCVRGFPYPTDPLCWQPDLLHQFDELFDDQNGTFLRFDFMYKGQDYVPIYLVQFEKNNIEEYKKNVVKHFEQYEEHVETKQKPSGDSPRLAIESVEWQPDNYSQNEALMEEGEPIALHELLASPVPEVEVDEIASIDPADSLTDEYIASISILSTSEDDLFDEALDSHQDHQSPIDKLEILPAAPLSFLRCDETILHGITFSSPALAVLYLILLKMGDIASKTINQAAWMLVADTPFIALNRYYTEKRSLSHLPVGFLAQNVRSATTYVMKYAQLPSIFLEAAKKLPSSIRDFYHHNHPVINLEEELYHMTFALVDFAANGAGCQEKLDQWKPILPLRTSINPKILIIGDPCYISRISFDGNCDVQRIPQLQSSTIHAPNQSATKILSNIAPIHHYDVAICLLGKSDIVQSANTAELRDRYRILVKACAKMGIPSLIMEPPPRLDSYSHLVTEAAQILRDESRACDNLRTIPMTQMSEPQKMLSLNDGVAFAAAGILRFMRILLQSVPQLRMKFTRT